MTEPLTPALNWCYELATRFLDEAADEVEAGGLGLDLSAVLQFGRHVEAAVIHGGTGDLAAVRLEAEALRRIGTSVSVHPNRSTVLRLVDDAWCAAALADPDDWNGWRAWFRDPSYLFSRYDDLLTELDRCVIRFCADGMDLAVAYEAASLILEP